MTPRFFLKITAAAVAFAFATASHAGEFPKGSPKFLTEYSKAQAASKTSKKPLVVVFSASWCPPCQANKSKVYPSADVQPYHEKFVWAYLDTDVAANAALAQRFQVRGIPHIQFVGSDGSNLGKVIGVTSPKAFSKKLKSILKKAKK